MSIGMHANNDTAKDHVNRGRKKNGGDNDEHILHGIGKDLAGLVACADTASITDNLNCPRSISD